MSFTERFGDRAADYAAARPSYPRAALEVLFAGLGDPADVVAADLGAGTGISARLLADYGAQVIAVEPNQAMRGSAEPHPRVRWLATTAESTGLDEAGVDLAVAFQAFHWFEAPRALAEMVRILRPGGRAGVVSNERDERDAFTAAYGDLVRRYQTDATERRRADALTAFAAFEGWHGGPRRSEVPHAQVLDAAGLHARTRSTSYLPRDGEAGTALHADLDALFARFARDGKITLALQTIVVVGDVGADGA